MADEISGFDPFQREMKLELESVYYPLGFPLRLATNGTEINMAAEESWGRYPQAFATPPLRLRVAVEPDSRVSMGCARYSLGLASDARCQM